MAEKSLRHRARTRRGVLSFRRTAGTRAAQPLEERDAGLLGKWDGFGIVARYVRQLREIPDRDAGGFPQIAEDLRLYHRGRQPAGRLDHTRAAEKNPRAARGKMKINLRVRSSVEFSTAN